MKDLLEELNSLKKHNDLMHDEIACLKMSTKKSEVMQ